MRDEIKNREYRVKSEVKNQKAKSAWKFNVEVQSFKEWISGQNHNHTNLCQSVAKNSLRVLRALRGFVLRALREFNLTDP